jgi:hypothetical protein
MDALFCIVARAPHELPRGEVDHHGCQRHVQQRASSSYIGPCVEIFGRAKHVQVQATKIDVVSGETVGTSHEKNNPRAPGRRKREKQVLSENADEYDRAGRPHQSSDDSVEPRMPPRVRHAGPCWMHVLPYSETLRTSVHLGIGCGGRNRSEPFGGVANGIPRKT